MKKKSAFTFIEVLIAMAVFSIGILAVLKLITNNLALMDRNNLKIQATLLAKEGMELVYSIRDSNIEKELSWNCIMDDKMYGWSSENLSNAIGWGNQSNFESVICEGYFNTGMYLQVAYDPNKYVYSKLLPVGQNDGFEGLYAKNKLYLYIGDFGGKYLSWYGYDYTGLQITGVNLMSKNTYFARYISFEPVREGENVLPLSKIMKVVSHVLYKKGGYTGEVLFESFIGNY